MRCFRRALDLCDIGLNLAPPEVEATTLRKLRAQAEAGMCASPPLAAALPAAFWRGTEAFGRGELTSAAAQFRDALREAPGCAQAHAHLGMALIGVGQYREGWREYEWRARLPWGAPRAMSAPRWDGRPMDGRTLVLWDEQGHGDAIQFIRFAAPAAAASKAIVIFHGRPRLARLFEGAAGVAASIRRDQDFPAPDAQASLMSLPAMLGLDGPQAAAVPYLAAEPSLVQSWRDRLAAYPRPWVGLVWQGNPGFFNDRQRSMQLESFLPLLRRFAGRASFFALQKGEGEAQIAALPDDVAVHALGYQLDTGTDGFVDTAAVIANLDLVVTTDTSVAHLAGGLGAPVWITLGRGADWRWGEAEAESTAFYPQARLFRRGAAEEWSGVVERLAAAAVDVFTTHGVGR
ncbi:MAG: glycosyltransferase family 9 protein [Polyangia bacterium]